jgi:hypothetical protein
VLFSSLYNKVVEEVPAYLAKRCKHAFYLFLLLFFNENLIVSVMDDHQVYVAAIPNSEERHVFKSLPEVKTFLNSPKVKDLNKSKLYISQFLII